MQQATAKQLSSSFRLHELKMATSIEGAMKRTPPKQEASSGFFPPLSPSPKQPLSSAPHSKHSSAPQRPYNSLPPSSHAPYNSHRSAGSSLSSRNSSCSVSSAESGGSTLEERAKRPKSILSRSIDAETLAIAIELSDLKARRDKDEEETFARIMESSNQLSSCLRHKSGRVTPRPRSKTAGNISVPPTVPYTGPGAHFLDWYIPKHIAGSRALQRSASASLAGRKRLICSPLHRPEKQEWMDKLIDPKASGLRIPTAVPPHIIDYPCTWQNSLKEDLNKYQLRNEQKPDSLQFTSLARKTGKNQIITDSSDLKLSGSMFSKAQVAPMPWFIVHPDWRNEPTIRNTWEELEAQKDKTSE